MKIKTSKLIFSMFAVVSMAVATALPAATTFNASPGSTLNDDGTNWSNNLPTSSNPGTVNVNSVWNTGSTLTGWHVNFTGGDLSTNSTGTRTFSGGVQTFNGGNLTGGNRQFATSGGASTSVNGGSSFAAGLLTITSSTFEVNGGSVNITGVSGGTGTININGDSTGFTLSSGTVNAPTAFGHNGQTGGLGNVWNLNGGTLTAGVLRYRSVALMQLGGTTAGSATFSGWAETNHTQSNVRIDWLPNTLMTLTIGVADWAEDEWVAGRMFFNGDSSADLGNLSWADATNSNIGLGGGYYFDWNSGTNTLALAIPEPSSSALLATGIIALAGFRRRISA
jgi:hypothetical protein